MDPSSAALGPVERALAGLATILSEAPWTLGPEDRARAQAAGLSDEMIVHAVALAAQFNYYNRIADAVDLDFDYTSPLPRPDKDAAREPVPAPPSAAWPERGGALGLSLGLRPATLEAFRRLREYQLEREAPLSRLDRRVLCRAVAASVGDGPSCEGLRDAEPRDTREETLAAYARKLSATPWRMALADLEALRALGLEDRGLLDVISVASFQALASRLALALDLPL